MLTDYKRSILRERRYVYLDGCWRHKGEEPDLPAFLVEILAEPQFESGIGRYISAVNRDVHRIRIGREL